MNETLIFYQINILNYFYYTYLYSPQAGFVKIMTSRTNQTRVLLDKFGVVIPKGLGILVNGCRVCCKMARKVGGRHVPVVGKAT